MRLNIRQKGVCESYLVPQLGKLSPASGNEGRKDSLGCEAEVSGSVSGRLHSAVSEQTVSLIVNQVVKNSDFVVRVFFPYLHFCIQNKSAIFIVEKLTVLLANS